MILLEKGEIDKILQTNINLKIDPILAIQPSVKINFEESFIKERNELMFNKYNYKEVYL
jgi:hypothetical protein